MWAVVPLKSPEKSKSRLSSVLNPVARRDLFFAVARHVISTLLCTPGVSHVMVVTASDEADTFARASGARVLRQDADRGTASAFEAAVDWFRPMRLERVLMIAGDLPLLNVGSVIQLMAVATIGPSVVVAPDRLHTGTNALLCCAPDAIPLCFGQDSFRRHCDAARRADLPLHIVESAQLALDVDVADDLDYLQRSLNAGGAATPRSVELDGVLASRSRLRIVGEVS